ncbi:MFS transporter [Gemmobacter nectariphilus]|uniref:MFS transporter n=1 Tax=Gemmobacter nectariphilus TaxID=220343 RepID=UPI000421E27F|nr:MFS transporter [Gemmobacter nectariphilus]
MLKVLGTSWPLLAGVMLLMVGNGIQGSLLGIRGALEGFSTFQMSFVMAGYFLGFLGGSRLAPLMIRRVGHVRVFAALGSLISAVLVLYPVVTDVWAWSVMRVLIGFCFSGVYVTAESWLNNASSNETRGQALSAYMIVQMIGIIASQILLNVGDPSGFVPFILPSVLVSLAFLPILLSATPAPVFDTTQRMGFARLFQISPLGCAGMLLTGGVYAAMMGMAGVWGMSVGLTVPQISVFVGAMYAGGLVLQFPVGWISDRMDRRRLILLLALAGAGVMALASVAPPAFGLLVALAFVLGGIVNPLYALLIAHTNDFLPNEEMAGASAGLLFLNGLGAVAGPLATGWMMERLGPSGFFVFIAGLLGGLAVYVLWRMTRRDTPPGAPGYHPIAPTASAIAVEAVMERSDS